MPFQSEKQRRYLWANEPEIARDWTDTYGSRIKKDDGGIARIGFFTGMREQEQRSKPAGGATMGGHGRGKDRPSTKPDQPPGDGSGGPDGPMYYKNIGDTNKHLRKKTLFTDDSDEAKDRQLSTVQKFKRIKGKFPEWAKQHYALKHFQPFVQKGTDINKKFFFDKVLNQRILPQYLKDLNISMGDEDSLQNAYEKWMLGRQEGTTDAYGNPWGGGERQGPEGYMGYPSYAAWKAAQGQGGTTEVAEVVEETPSDFQASLTTGANNPFDYYVGSDPTAANKAWGQQFGADPRTMGMTSYAANGGRIPAAFGGIMDSSTGRRAYGFGSFFKKIGRAAKKVLKSPIAKIGIGALGAYGLGGGFTGGFSMANLRGAPGIKQLLTKKGAGNAWDWGKLAIAGSTALPFILGGEEEDEGSKFDYMGAKNAYADEIMRLRRGVMAGSLKDAATQSFLPVNYREGGRIGLEGGGDPLLREEYNKYVFEMEEMELTPMSFEEFKAQARAGMYAGGQSIPSDYTMEDAMMTTTQDKLGGITDVMKQADLSRAGDVGQFYAAQGGRIGYAGGSGRPPITMGQPIQAPQMPGPQAPPTPMPAPQPNRMAGMPGGMPGGMNPMGGGMNPMMGRPMMRAMPARKMAQEGGLMDLGGMEKDYRNDGGFVPLGGEEKADDVPARLSKNEFVFTADAVRGAGDGDIDKGAEIMENIMKNLEQGGQISEETQGLSGAQEMFGVSERLSEVV